MSKFLLFVLLVESKIESIRGYRECGCETCLEAESAAISEVETAAFQFVMHDVSKNEWFNTAMLKLGWKKI